ncbi:MAG: hypothetical protein ACTS85_02425 [Arsenophonus sp. NC-PG7-MAG3]
MQWQRYSWAQSAKYCLVHKITNVVLLLLKGIQLKVNDDATVGNMVSREAQCR